jgi:hypothetical protein
VLQQRALITLLSDQSQERTLFRQPERRSRTADIMRKNSALRGRRYRKNRRYQTQRDNAHLEIGHLFMEVVYVSPLS